MLSLNTGGQYDPATDTWAATSTGANSPSGRYSHSGIWTGNRMVVWGGYNGSAYLYSGAMYKLGIVSLFGPSCGVAPVVLSTDSPFTFYQWIKDGADILGATAATYPAITSGTYAVRVTDAGGCTGTSIGQLVQLAAVISSHPVSRNVCLGNTATFYVTATGDPLTYQWQVNQGAGFTNLSNTPPYSGTATATLNLSAVPAKMNGYSYRCIISNPCSGTTTSNPATLTVGDPQLEIRPETWANKTTLSWPASAASYTVYRGTLADLPALSTSAVNSCRKYSGTSTSATILDDSAGVPGGFYWYLVTGTNATGCEGTAGYGTAGERILNASGVCP